MILIWCFLCFGLSSCLQQNVTEDQLVIAQIVFRHGDRTIEMSYPNDPYKDVKYWPEGYGQLTIAGKQRMFELGKFLRRRYETLLGDGSYTPDKIFTISSSYDRTMNSASLVLAGLFPPNNNQIWNEDLPWQPIPVHTDKNYIIETINLCAWIKGFREILHSVEVQTLTNRHKELFQYIEEHSGQPNPSILNLYYVYLTLQVELQTNKTLPVWTQKVFFPGSDMEYLAQQIYPLNSGSPELKKITAGFILKEMLNNCERKMLPTSSSDPSIFLYSRHDIAISSILIALGVFEPHFPSYGSSVHFEMYKSSENYYIQILYKNSSEEILTPLNIPNCGTKCTLDQLYDLLKEVLPSEKSIEDFGSPVICTLQ